MSKKSKLIEEKDANYEIKKQRIGGIGIVYIKYTLDQNLFENNQYLRLFGEKFVQKNKNNCKLSIAGKTYEIKCKINQEEFENYNIKKNDEILEVQLKGKAIEDMSSLFFLCTSLIYVNFSSFSSKNVTNMEAMFYGCKSLTQVDLSSFNTQKVVNMLGMFYGCENLIKADLSSFNTRKVLGMRSMFKGCKSLTKIDLSAFNTENVVDMFEIFDDCKNLVKVDISSFKFQNAYNIDAMFKNCHSLIKTGRENNNKIKHNIKSNESELLLIEV